MASISRDEEHLRGTTDSERMNSYIRRTTTGRCAITPTNTLASGRSSDFLDVISQIAILYRKNAIPMQNYDAWDLEPLGKGSVFHVSSANTVLESPSDVAKHQLTRTKTKIVLKKSPILVYGKHGDPFDTDDAHDAARGLLRELQVLTFVGNNAHPNIVNLLGIAWDYDCCVSETLEPPF